jgi:uncharacterized protein (TIGR03437 family)
MPRHRSARLSRSLSTLTLAQLPPSFSHSGKPGARQRFLLFACLLASALLIMFLLAQLSARADSVNPTAVVTVDAASYQQVLTPNAIASAFGTQLATQTATATDANPELAGIQLPTTLGGTTVEVNGVDAGLLFVSAGQVNFIIPAETGAGTASIVVRSSDGIISQGTMTVVTAAPALFTFAQNGQGAPAAIITADGISYELAGNLDGSTRPLQAGHFLVLFGTGVRGASSGSVRVLIGGIDAPVFFAGAQADFVGLDQINVQIPAQLQGRGVVDVVVTVGSVASNLVNIEIAGSSAGPTPPSVSGFGVSSALAGQTITIQGSNFSTAAAQNRVRIGSIEALVTQATANQLTVVVPFGVATGQVKVETDQGEGQSSGNLSILTSISGTIQSTVGAALQGATVRLAGTSKVAVSNDQGLFLLGDVPAGAAVLEVDGTTVQTSPPYPSVTLKMVVSANRDNQMAQPVSLQQSTGQSVNVGGSGGSSRRLAGKRHTLTSVQVTTNGVTLNIPGTVTFTNGSTTGTITLTAVDRGLLPVQLPPKIFSSTIVQITPFDAVFTPSANITFPNRDSIPAGTVVDLYAYDNSITPSGFTKRGTAQVSDDGQTIVGTGVIDRASYWFAAPPQIQTTTVKGLVLHADGKPVRNARALVRGRNALSDGNGAFTISDVPVKAGDQLQVDVEFLSPTGRALKASKTVAAVPSGVTDAGTLQLPAEPTLVLALNPRSLTLMAGEGATLQVSTTLPAPAGGLQLNLSKDLSLLSLGSPLVTIPEGQLTASFTVNAIAPGKVIVTAATLDNSVKATTTVLITRPAPVLSSLTPSSGPPSTQIRINGTGFSLVPRQNLVAFEQQGQIILAAPDTIKVLDATTTPFLSATVPPLASGSSLVYVVSLDANGVPSAASNKLPFAVTGPPQIVSISPNPAEVGTDVIITGSGFSSVLTENAVLFSAPHLIIPGSTQPVYARGKVITASDSSLRVRVPGHAASGPVIVVRNPARPISQDAGLARLDKMGGSASQLFLDFAVRPSSKFVARRPMTTFGNPFQHSTNLAATATRLVAANPSSFEVLLFDISGTNAATPLSLSPVTFSNSLPVEVAADGNLAIVGLQPNSGPPPQGKQLQTHAPSAQLIDLGTGTARGTITLGTTQQPFNVKVALAGTTALVAADGVLYTYNVSAPATPVQLGSIALGSNIWALAANSSLALASLGDRLAVIDISSPGAPVLKSTISDFTPLFSGSLPFEVEFFNEIEAVALNGTMGIAAVNSAIVLLDLSAPSAPVLLSSAGLSFDADSLAVNGSTLIVGGEIAGVMTVDISSPTRPVTTAFFDTPGGDPGVLGVASAGNFIYTNEAFSFFTDDINVPNGLISVIQFAGALPTPIPEFEPLVSGPVAPGDLLTLRGYNLGQKPSDISVTIGGASAPVLFANPTSYVPATNITEITVQVPLNAQPVGQILPLNLQVGGTAVGRNLNYTATGSPLKRIKSFHTGLPSAEAITRLGISPFVAVASEETGISIINTDTSEIASRVTVGQWRNAAEISQFAYARIGSNDYLVIFGFNQETKTPGLVIINVSNPAKPFVVSDTAFAALRPSSPSGGLALATQGGLRVTSGGNRLAGGRNQLATSSGPFFDHDRISNLVVSGHIVYAHTGVLAAFDLSNPSQPLLKGTFKPMNASISEHTSGIAVTGTSTLALTTFEGTIYLLNAADPANIQSLGKYIAPPPQSAEPPASFNGAVAFINPNLVVAASQFNGRLYFVDFATPANPTLKSQLPAFANSVVVDPTGNRLLLANHGSNPFAGTLGSGDFAVVDISIISSPRLQASINTPGGGSGLVQMGTNLYALVDGADSPVGLHLISVNPSGLPATEEPRSELRARQR